MSSVQIDQEPVMVAEATSDSTICVEVNDSVARHASSDSDSRRYDTSRIVDDVLNTPNYLHRLFSNSCCLLLGDCFAILLAVFLSGLIRYLLKDHIMPPSRSFWLIPTWCLGACFFRLVPGWGNGPVEELRRIQTLLISMFGVAALLLFLSKSGDISSRIKFVVIYFLCVPLIPFVRMLVKRMLSRRKKWGVPVVVYGNDRTVAHVVDVLSQEQGLGYQPVGVFDDQSELGEMVHDTPVIGRLNDSTRRASIAILGAPSIHREKLAGLLEGSLSRYRRVIIIPDLLEIPSLWVTSKDFMGVLGLEVVRNLLNPVARWMKQLGEVLFILLIAPVWIPICLVLTSLIALCDRANPFYFQQRVGRHGKLFHVLKFRTMVPDAENVLQQKMDESPELSHEWNNNCKLKVDPRITRIGQILRQTSLDELPQFINVLLCNMSLVGPRPLPSYHHEKLPERVRKLREQVLPGITGLWQVSGRSESGNVGMERWDAYYVRNWSIWLDIVIMIRTVRALVRKDGAY